MKRSTKVVLPVLILLIGFALMVGMLSLRTDPPKRAPETRSKIVETAVVELRTVPTKITAFGRVASAQPIQLYAEAAGTLEQGDVSFKPAQSFAKGDLLLKIDDRQARLDLNSVKSDLMHALATVLPEIKVDFPGEYRIWQEYFDNCRFDRKVEPLPETDNPRIRLFMSRFNVYKLYFAVCDLEIKLEKHFFYAPFNGSIASTALRVGSTARVGSLLGEIINLEQMEVAVPVEADNLPWIDNRREVTFSSSEVAGRWTGKVIRVGSDIDTRTQTVEVFMAVDDGQAASLLNGVFLEAHLPGRGIAGAYPVPPKAIYEDSYVYLIVDGLLERRDINIVRREADQVIVDGGLQNGDTLVVEIMQGVAPGMPAEPRIVASESRGQ